MTSSRRTHRSPADGRNLLVVAASESDADLRWITGFVAPDPFVFVRTARGRRMVAVSDLEFDRARAQASVHRVLPIARFFDAARRRGVRRPALADAVRELLRELRIRSVVVPASFPAGLADALRRRGVSVRALEGALFPQRWIKRPDEVRAIRRTMRATEAGLAAGIEMIRRARIRRGRLELDGRALRAEDVRRAIETEIFARGAIPAHTIVAPGRQGCDPHETGSGILRAGVPVILDVFPRDARTGYFADITRTVVRGRPDPRVERMARAVRDAQRLALRMIRPGVRARDIHRAVHALFAERGFRTGRFDGRMQGFFHGTGHGLGLEIHEPPRIGEGPDILHAGMVVTVEPGLYYWPLGGVRIEDTVLVTRTGVRNLTRFPKTFELD